MLADDRPGHAAQALGVAEALGLPFRVHRLGYGRLAALSALLPRASLAGLDRASRRALLPPWPRLVIAAGRRTVPVARWLKRRSGGVTRLVQLMDPGDWRDLDLLAIPAHDAPRPDPRVVVTLGAAHRLHAETLQRAARAWTERVALLPRPRIAVLVGGRSPHARWPAGWAQRLVAEAEALASARGGSLMLTTSRRTPDAAVKVLDREGPVPAWQHFHGAPGDNPYAGMLALADAVIVTADSASMLTEACATGRQVYAFGADAVRGSKLAALLDALQAEGRVLPLGAAWSERRFAPLRPQDDIAGAIRSRQLV